MFKTQDIQNYNDILQKKKNKWANATLISKKKMVNICIQREKRGNHLNPLANFQEKNIADLNEKKSKKKKTASNYNQEKISYNRAL